MTPPSSCSSRRRRSPRGPRRERQRPARGRALGDHSTVERTDARVATARHGQREPERAALPWGTLRPDAPAVLLDDSLAYGQADACAGVVVLAVQSREGLEDSFRLAGVHADAIVGDGEDGRV